MAEAATTVFGAEGDRAIFVYAQGGGISSTKDFDPLRDSSFKTGYDLGGGVGVQVNRYVAVRGNFIWAHSRGDDLDLDVPSFNTAVFHRYIYGGDVQLGYPLRLGFTPYLFAGGGR